MRPRRAKFQRQHSAYFVSTQTAQRQPFFRHERWAVLLRETILQYSQEEYSLHAYVIMPDHVHILLVPNSTLEKAVQLIKGGFSFRAKKSFNWKFDIWQQGFADHRIRDEADWDRHLEYIQGNPVKAGLVDDWKAYPYVSFRVPRYPQGLKPLEKSGAVEVRAEARTLQVEARSFEAIEKEVD